MPVIATKRTDGKVELHDIVEGRIARVELEPAVLEDVPGGTETRGDLAAKPEVDTGGVLVVGRKVLVLEAHTDVGSEALHHLPRVLNIEGMVVTACCSGDLITITDVDVTPVALAGTGVSACSPSPGHVLRHNSCAVGST